VAEALDGLEVHEERMGENLDATGGLLMAESVSTAIANAGMGRLEAHELVGEASKRAVEGGRSLRDELLDDEQVTERLSEDEIDRALDPAAYLGAAGEFVDRALELQRQEEDSA
jgi:3-carboxy-cis,cis-muconate cycloisomerase